MLFAGCDVGSLTAKAVIMDGEVIVSHAMARVAPAAEVSAQQVMDKALEKAGLDMGDIAACCATGYGRDSIPFATRNMSEISCHGMGAFWAASQVHTVIDIGGQDCKVINVDGRGMVTDFVMNDKCAAGTGRSLEILSRAIDLRLEDLGPQSLRSKKKIAISNRCGIFMELEVLQHFYEGKKPRDIARGINRAVAKRVAFLARGVRLAPGFALTGGVSKNPGVVRELESLLDVTFIPLHVDAQLVGAVGAAVFAGMDTLPGTTERLNP